MFQRFRQFLSANKFGAALWLGIALMMWASFQRSATYPGIPGGTGGGPPIAPTQHMPRTAERPSATP